MAEKQSLFSEISEEEEEEEVKEYARLYEEGGLQAPNAYLEEKSDQWKEIPLNIGIIGNSGSGKSSFINAIRGLTGDDEGAAAVGVTETTAEPTPYAHPNNQQLKFWDLPGVGTPNFPREVYLEKIYFEKFDFFLIISSIRFAENDGWLAEEIDQKKKRFFFVRTKIDSDIQNDKKAHPRTHKKEGVLTKIQDDIKQNLGRKLYDDKKVFLIDNYKRQMYDFNKLEQRIIEDFPVLKREALILSLSTLSEWMIREKAQTLRKSIWKSCLASGAIALVPIPGTSMLADSEIILVQSKFYLRQLGLDEESLNRTAKVTSCDVTILRKFIDSTIIKGLLTWKGVVDFTRVITIETWALAAVEVVLRLIPIIGSIISFKTTYAILNEILKTMEEVAVNVVQVAVNNSANQLLDDDSEN